MSAAGVVRAGALTSVQDGGRHGLRHLGVPCSGALDVAAWRLANRLVGNPGGAATLETTFDGVALCFERDVVVAVTGAGCAVRVDATAVGWSVPVRVRAGQILDVGRATHGLRAYVAVDGGFDVAEVLGSRSRDLLTDIGPPVLTDGDRLPLGRPVPTPAAIGYAPYPLPGRDVTLPLWLGPRDDWFTTDAIDRVLHTAWSVSPVIDRTGIRLRGAPLERRIKAELASEGVVAGSVQVPPSGEPVILLADHPVTGGYPVIGVVDVPDLWRCAQLVPGATVRFVRRR